MGKICQQFKTSRDTLFEMGPACLNLVLRRLVPDEQFRFITFQEGDFYRGNLTMLVYNYIPDKVIVCVESVASLKPALKDLTELNPGLQWRFGAVNYFDACNGKDFCITAELGLTLVPLRINTEGILVGRWPASE